MPAITTDLPCYQQRRRVTLSGSGFAAGATYTVTREGTQLGTGAVGADGHLQGTFSSGALPGGVAERVFSLQATDGTSTASAHYRVTSFTAAFTPSRATPTTDVRFSAFGFGRLASVYVHYVRENAKAASGSILLGRATGPCGKISRTAAQPLFPFKPKAGRWLLQFDTRIGYSPKAVPRFVRPVTVRG